MRHFLPMVCLGLCLTASASSQTNPTTVQGAAQKFDEFGDVYPTDAAARLDNSFSTEYEDGLEGFANALRKEPRSSAYIIAYSQYRLEPREDQKGRTRRAQQDPKGTALKELKQKQAELVKTYGISSSRIRLVEGGYRNWRAIEFWIVPSGAYAPVPTPNVFPKRRPVL